MTSIPPVIAETAPELQNICNQISNEVAFYKFEINFFYKLFNKYFHPLIETEKLSLIQQLIRGLKELEDKEEKLRQSIRKFTSSYKHLAQKADHESIDKLNRLLENMYLHEQDLFEYFKEFKLVFFKKFESLIHAERGSHLLPT
jgi:hypothetical protein